MTNSRLRISCLVVLLSLLFAACATRDERIREKSAAFASLSPVQKAQIEKGVIAVGFTPDMVYMAMGNASRVEAAAGQEGVSEIWIYNNFYVNGGKAGFDYAAPTTEAPYQPSRYEAGTTRPRGIGTPQSIATTGPPQGVMPEPADLPVYTLLVEFKDGKVAKLGIRPR